MLGKGMVQVRRSITAAGAGDLTETEWRSAANALHLPRSSPNPPTSPSPGSGVSEIRRAVENLLELLLALRCRCTFCGSGSGGRVRSSQPAHPNEIRT